MIDNMATSTTEPLRAMFGVAEAAAVGAGAGAGAEAEGGGGGGKAGCLTAADATMDPRRRNDGVPVAALDEESIPAMMEPRRRSGDAMTVAGVDGVGGAGVVTAGMIG